MSLIETIARTAIDLLLKAVEARSERDKIKALRVLQAEADQEASRREARMLHDQARKRR